MTTAKRNPFRLTASVNTFAAASDQAIRLFSIDAYTGAVIDSHYGRLTFDVAGMKAKSKIPILREHQRDRIVGYGETFSQDQVFMVNGKFTAATPDGQECLALADEGYPWQASVGIRPVKIKTLKANETLVVNGKTLSGPAEVWTQSEVGEVSFVSLGADNNTSISVFSDSSIEIEAEIESSDEAPPQAIKEEPPMTKEEFLTQNPEMAAELKAEGIAEERARVMTILSQETDHIAILKNAIEAGTPADGIFKALYEAERNFRMTGLQTLSDQAPPSVGQTRDETIVSPVSTPKSFFGEVELAMKEKSMTRAQAVRHVQAAMPDLHAAYIAEQKNQ